jgi:hypothetical protein
MKQSRRNAMVCNVLNEGESTVEEVCTLYGIAKEVIMGFAFRGSRKITKHFNEYSKSLTETGTKGMPMI